MRRRPEEHRPIAGIFGQGQPEDHALQETITGTGKV